MTCTYELDFKQSLIKCTGKGIENSCERKKCFQFSLQTVSFLKKQPIKLQSEKCVRKCWLYGPAMTLETKTVIYPCTRNRCSIPCPCYLCRKKHPKCCVPSSQSCKCKECLSFFINHTKYHAALHHGCKQCFQLTQIFPHLNFNLLHTTKIKIPYGLVEASSYINNKLSEKKTFVHHFLNEQNMQCVWCKATFHSGGNMIFLSLIVISIAKAKLYLVMIVERFSVINLPFKGTSKLFINLVNVRYLSVRDVI